MHCLRPQGAWHTVRNAGLPRVDLLLETVKPFLEEKSKIQKAGGRFNQRQSPKSSDLCGLRGEQE